MYKVMYWVLEDSTPGNVEEVFCVEHTFSTIVDADRYITEMVNTLGNVKECATDPDGGPGILREFEEKNNGYKRYHEFMITYEFKEEG